MGSVYFKIIKKINNNKKGESCSKQKTTKFFIISTFETLLHPDTIIIPSPFALCKNSQTTCRTGHQVDITLSFNFSSIINIPLAAKEPQISFIPNICCYFSVISQKTECFFHLRQSRTCAVWEPQKQSSCSRQTPSPVPVRRKYHANFWSSSG